jgi:hypothetical protein
MISIQILEPKHKSNPRDAFVATGEVMFGDGDDYKDFRLAPIYRTAGYESQIEELVVLLDAMENFAWIDDREYSDLANYSKWFPAEADYANGWHGGNPFLDDVFIGTLWRYAITYYDSEGIEHTVSITAQD